MDQYKKITKDTFDILKNKYKEKTRKMMNEDLVKTIEFEYACQFLHSMRMDMS